MMKNPNSLYYKELGLIKDYKFILHYTNMYDKILLDV